jgi:hypothetical protein
MRKPHLFKTPGGCEPCGNHPSAILATRSFQMGSRLANSSGVSGTPGGLPHTSKYSCAQFVSRTLASPRFWPGCLTCAVSGQQSPSPIFSMGLRSLAKMPAASLALLRLARRPAGSGRAAAITPYRFLETAGGRGRALRGVFDSSSPRTPFGGKWARCGDHALPFFPNGRGPGEGFARGL